MINGEKTRVAGHETYQVTRHKFKIQNQVDFPIHELKLIDRMRYVKINEDWQAWLLSSGQHFQKRGFKNKMQTGFKF